MVVWIRSVAFLLSFGHRPEFYRAVLTWWLDAQSEFCYEGNMQHIYTMCRPAAAAEITYSLKKRNHDRHYGSGNRERWYVNSIYM